MRHRISPVIIGLLMLHTATALAQTRARLVEELRIGSVLDDGPTMFGAIYALEVDPLGRIYVLDHHALEVRVFSAQGKHVRTMGRKGAGPGEFANPTGMTWDRAGRLWIADPGNGRYAVFDTSGSFVRTVQRPISGWGLPWRGAFDKAGNLVEGTSGRSRAGAREELFVRMKVGSTLTPVDTVRLAGVEDQYLEFKGDNGEHALVGLPFATTQVVNFDARGFVWSGVSDRYRIAQMTLGGDTVRIFHRPFTRPPVTRAERDEALGRLKGFTKTPGQFASRIPATKPAWVTYVVAPDGGLWVFSSTTTTGSTIDRFDPNGRWIQTATSPAKISRLPAVPIVRGGKLYGVVRDADDAQFVLRMRVESVR